MQVSLPLSLSLGGESVRIETGTVKSIEFESIDSTAFHHRDQETINCFIMFEITKSKTIVSYVVMWINIMKYKHLFYIIHNFLLHGSINNNHKISYA